MRSKKLTRNALLQAVADVVGSDTTGRQVAAVLDALIAVGHAELKKNGVFVLPGFAKFVVKKKPARPARKGINPFTKQPTTFAAKPATRVVRARPLVAIKDALR
jgi:DNA-binding protein HU-beta